MESFATILTRIRSSVRMNEEMSGERGRSLECFTTLFTLEHFFDVMYRSSAAEPSEEREYIARL
jgi:hypothetical protein